MSFLPALLLAAVSPDTDPFAALEWHLDNDGSRTDLWPELLGGSDIDAPAAWLITRGDPAVVIAVLDTGFPAAHPDLPGRVAPYDFVDLDDDPSPIGNASLDAHGLAVAALALAPENGAGVTGVCPACTLLPVRVLSSDPLARDGLLAAAIRWAAERADVIVASWSFDPGAFVPPEVHDAIRFAAREGRGGRGCVVVFSAGNRAEAIEPFTPQAMRDVLTVGATDERDQRAGYSNRGPGLGLMAPGGVQDGFDGQARIPRAKLVTADLEGDAGNSPSRDALLAPGIVDDPAVTASFFGTSGSAPIVGGVAALLLAVRPELSAREVVWILTETASKVGGADYASGGGWHPDYGWGRVDAGAAVALADAGGYCIESAELCDNLADDDCDRLADAADPDCGGPDARPFFVPLGLSCDGSTDCGDGFCSAVEGALAVRSCTALCDFDCPAQAACAGREGEARCHSRCAAPNDCPNGFACITPDAGLLPPGYAPVPICVPLCTRDDQCDVAQCREGACAGAPAVPVLPPGLEGGGCDCAATGRVPLLVVALAAWARSAWARWRRDR